MDDAERRELERGLRFVNDAMTVSAQTGTRALEDVHALVELLIAQGTISLQGYERRRQMLERDQASQQTPQRVHLAVYEDKYAIEPTLIDCDARIPLCKARCCSFTFHLTTQDLDEGSVRWDYARPYLIRREADGYCTHIKRDTQTCGIHAQRPAVCRSYDCRKDARIWKDFENRIPADPPAPPAAAAPAPAPEALTPITEVRSVGPADAPTG